MNSLNVDTAASIFSLAGRVLCGMKVCKSFRDEFPKFAALKVVMYISPELDIEDIHIPDMTTLTTLTTKQLLEWCCTCRINPPPLPFFTARRGEGRRRLLSSTFRRDLINMLDAGRETRKVVRPSCALSIFLERWNSQFFGKIEGLKKFQHVKLRVHFAGFYLDLRTDEQSDEEGGLNAAKDHTAIHLQLDQASHANQRPSRRSKFTNRIIQEFYSSLIIFFQMSSICSATLSTTTTDRLYISSRRRALTRPSPPTMVNNNSRRLLLLPSRGVR